MGRAPDRTPGAGASSATPSGAAGGDLTGSYPDPQIAAGVIVNADVNASAAIAYSKLNLGTSIVNADISASAAIAATKLSGVVPTTTWTTKGDILAASAASTPARVGVGANGLSLVADSTQTSGVKWALPNPALYSSGAYYALPFGTGTSAGTNAQLRLTPVRLEASGTIDRLMVESTTGGASSVVRVCVYANRASGEMAPGLLLGETGDLTSTGTGVLGDSAALFTSFAVSAGQLVWMGAVTHSATPPTLRATTTANFNQFVGTTTAVGTTAGSVGTYLYNSTPTGALPADLSATAPSTTGGAAYKVAWRCT